jgi:hypothetical protein
MDRVELVSNMFKRLNDLALKGRKALDRLNVFCSSWQDRLVGAYARLVIATSELCKSDDESAKTLCRELTEVRLYLAKVIYGTYSAVFSCSTLLEVPRIYLSTLEDFKEDFMRGDIEGLDLELKKALKEAEELGSACRDYTSIAMNASKSVLDTVGRLLRDRVALVPKEWKELKLRKTLKIVQLIVKIDKLVSIHFANLICLRKLAEHWHETITDGLKMLNRVLSTFLKTRKEKEKEGEK